MNEATIRRLQANPHYKPSAKQMQEIADSTRAPMQKLEDEKPEGVELRTEELPRQKPVIRRRRNTNERS